MKWYTIPSVLICGLNSMLAAIILCLAAFHLYTDKSTNAPILPNEQWICLVTCLLPFSVVWMIVSVAGIFISMSRRRMILASLIIALYTVLFGGSIYFTISFGNQLGLEEVPPETLFNITLNLISHQQAEAWIPGWLENVQKQSNQCCGVLTYRDYEEFWPNTPTKIPRSCCRNSKELPTATCPGDLTQIPFPNTPANFIKVETGCMDEINEAARHHIRESYQNSIVMNVFIGLAVFSFLILYVKRYLAGESEDISKRAKLAPSGEGDSVTGGEVPIIVASSQQITATSLDSMEPNPPIVISAENFPVITEQKPSQNYYYSKEKEIPKEKELPHFTLSRPQPSMTKINKANTVFAGLQQRPMEASTGDDMTIGGGNIGRQEIYLAQDSTDRQIPDTLTPARKLAPEKVDRAERADRVERAERPDRQDRPERIERPERTEKPERVERPDRIERPERPEKYERPERMERPDRTERQPRTGQTSSAGEDDGDLVRSSDHEYNSGSPPGSPTGRRKKVRKLGLAHHKNEHHHHHHHKE